MAFRNETTLEFSEKPAFHLGSHLGILLKETHTQVFPSRVEEELFTVIERPVRQSNLYQKEWKAIRSPADDRNIVIKKPDKGSCVVTWDRNDYIAEAKNNSPIKSHISRSILKRKTCVTS